MTNTEALAILGVDPDASVKEITTRFHALAREQHPDIGGDADEFALLKLAYDVLVGRVASTPGPHERVRDFTWDADGVSVGWPATSTSGSPDRATEHEPGAVTTPAPTTVRHAAPHAWSHTRVVRTVVFALFSPVIGVLFLLGWSVFLGRWPASARGVLVAIGLCALGWVALHAALTSVHGLGAIHLLEWSPFGWLGLRVVGTRIGNA